MDKLPESAAFEHAGTKSTTRPLLCSTTLSPQPSLIADARPAQVQLPTVCRARTTCGSRGQAPGQSNAAFCTSVCRAGRAHGIRENNGDRPTIVKLICTSPSSMPSKPSTRMGTSGMINTSRSSGYVLRCSTEYTSSPCSSGMRMCNNTMFGASLYITAVLRSTEVEVRPGSATSWPMGKNWGKVSILGKTMLRQSSRDGSRQADGSPAKRPRSNTKKFLRDWYFSSRICRLICRQSKLLASSGLYHSVTNRPQVSKLV
mmetsp:Transcript_13135/g.36062  ORF Transcript_13135/g.36062 Transcript_13135/m.36062 type:complete len:259 (+) Transcript_13135:273-1049(+)